MSLFSLREDRGPLAAVEIAGHRIAAVRLESRGGRRVIAAHASELLPDGFIIPSLTAANIVNRAGVLQVLSRVWQEIDRPKRIGLVIPDPVAKVSLIRFQHVPAKVSELEQLIRWQLKKTAPFPIEEAQLSYAPAAVADDGQEFLVTVARTDVVLEYESLCTEVGTYPGLVDVSTSSVVNTVLATSGRDDNDCLLVNVVRDWVSLAVLRGGHVVLLRSRAVEGDDTLADLVHQTAMYYEDRLNGSGFGRVLLCGAASTGGGNELERLQRTLGERLNTPVTTIDPTRAAALSDRVFASAALFDSVTPALGLLVRERGAAA